MFAKKYDGFVRFLPGAAAIGFFVLMFLAFLFLYIPVLAQAEAVAVLSVESLSGFLDKIEGFFNLVPGWLKNLSVVISAASAVAAMTPSPKVGSYLALLRRLIDLLAFNFGGAKNEVKK